jgi:hypothetical protein
MIRQTEKSVVTISAKNGLTIGVKHIKTGLTIGVKHIKTGLTIGVKHIKTGLTISNSIRPNEMLYWQTRSMSVLKLKETVVNPGK